MNKYTVMLVVMVVGFGFMHFRYSRLNAQQQQNGSKMRLADAEFTRLDFSLNGVNDGDSQAAAGRCMDERTRYPGITLPEDLWDDFCRCVGVHLVAHVYPLVSDTCRQPGRLDFKDSFCKVLDPKKPHQVNDRSQKIVKDCYAWVSAPPPAPAQPPGFGGPAGARPNGTPPPGVPMNGFPGGQAPGGMAPPPANPNGIPPNGMPGGNANPAYPPPSNTGNPNVPPPIPPMPAPAPAPGN